MSAIISCTAGGALLIGYLLKAKIGFEIASFLGACIGALVGFWILVGEKIKELEKEQESAGNKGSGK